MIELYPFQQEDLDKAEGQRGFLNADQMGLGKTVTGLWELKDSTGPNLAIVPKQVISVWEDHMDLLGIKNVEVTNYEQIRIDPKWRKTNWEYVLCDEAQYLKNRKAQRTRAVKQLHAWRKRAFTGTPMINRPDELWSILNWLNPVEWKSYWKFFNMYVDYRVNQWHGYYEILGPKNVPDLRKRIDHMYIRHLKKDVYPQLPDKYYSTVKVDLGQQQRRAYKEMEKDFLAWIGAQESEALPAPTVLAQLTRLSQFSVGYATIVDGKVQLTEPSSKLDAVMEIIDGTDEPIVVFTQFRGVVRLLADRLSRSRIPTSILHGETPQEKRSAVVKDFQSGRTRVFACTAQTGGVGITLTAASTGVFVDRSWSPAVNEQAEDRLHRIGQQNAVQIIDIEAEGTVDKIRREKVELKKSWFKEVFGE